MASTLKPNTMSDILTVILISVHMGPRQPHDCEQKRRIWALVSCFCDSSPQCHMGTLGKTLSWFSCLITWSIFIPFIPLTFHVWLKFAVGMPTTMVWDSMYFRSSILKWKLKGSLKSQFDCILLGQTHKGMFFSEVETVKGYFDKANMWRSVSLK